MQSLQVEYAKKKVILFMLSPVRENINLESVRFPVIYRVNQAEYGIHILVAASQEYENTYSTLRMQR